MSFYLPVYCQNNIDLYNASCIEYNFLAVFIQVELMHFGGEIISKNVKVNYNFKVVFFVLSQI